MFSLSRTPLAVDTFIEVCKMNTQNRVRKLFSTWPTVKRVCRFWYKRLKKEVINQKFGLDN